MVSRSGRRRDAFTGITDDSYADLRLRVQEVRKEIRGDYADHRTREEESPMPQVLVQTSWPAYSGRFCHDFEEELATHCECFRLPSPEFPPRGKSVTVRWTDLFSLD